MVNLQMITDVPSSADCPKKYDVFLSFRGEDTRNNFTSHLYGSLELKNVKTFIDYELQRGDEISPTLMKAIEESHASIVIFSEDYASSKWCLEELSKIMVCKKSMGQDVIPVFYKVDPSHVRNQTGSYEQVFRKHEEDMRHNMERVQKWRAALTEAANLAGFTWDSKCDRSEFEFIKNIVGDVTKKLNLRYPIELKKLVGIEEMYDEIELLLKNRSSEVRIIGIWGMGGIGKTTLATALYAKLSVSFESACFLENVREKSEKKGQNALRKKIFSKLLKDENLSGNFDIARLRRRKVFIVLDDVATPMQLDGIIDGDWLGSGSRIIVTTRNKHVLKDDHEIYEVKQLNHDDSLELFCANAFSAMYTKIGYEELLESVIDYCKGLPLALKVLGVYFHGKSKGVWESDLKKLKQYPDMDIHRVLRLSYESLDQTQKDIFLDIACCFKGKSRDLATSFFEACEFFPNSGIPILVYMALITISSGNNIEMHDLIQEMGREIVRQESIKYPERRSRLWNPKEVYDVLKNNRGTEVVEGIVFDMSQIQKDIILSSDSFAKMSKLRYLEFYDRHMNYNNYVCLPDGLRSLPDELRYLCWPTYCLTSLPSTFCAEMLVEFIMPNSNLEKLWDGVQNLGNLKKIDLQGSKQLVEIPDLSMALNLDQVLLGYCESLREVHPSIFSLPNLRLLNLNHCTRIESLTTDIHMQSLRILWLCYCSSLKEFSVTSEEMEVLYLSGTAIHYLPSSIFSNRKLNNLELRDCVNLKIDWNKLFDDRVFEYLKGLSLSGCKQLDATDLGHILDGVPSLEWLDIRGSNVERLPANVKNLSMLRELELDNCMKLVALPELPPSLIRINAINCISLELDTQRLLLQQYISSGPRDPDYGYVMLPGGHVPELFRSTTETTSVSIPSLPLSGLSGFLLCIVLPKKRTYNHILQACCDIYEHDEVNFRRWRSSIMSFGVFNSNHVIFWHVEIKDLQKIQEGGANDHYNNISFQFDIQHSEDKLMKEEIKGCGVLPLYAKDLELKLGGIVTKDIVEFQSNAQSQTSNNQEPLPLTDTQMQDEKKDSCFMGNDINPVSQRVNPQHMVVKPVEEYNDIVELESNPTKISKRRKGAKNKKNRKEMQQRLGSPSGTDGSDCSLGEETTLSSIHHSGSVSVNRSDNNNFIGKDNLNIVAFSSVIVSVISLIIAEIGRRRSKPSFLIFYAVVSSIAMLLLNAYLDKQYSLLKAIQDFSFGETRKFGAEDFPGFQAGMLVYLLTLLVFNIFTIITVVSLLFNMSPPKKAS